MFSRLPVPAATAKDNPPPADRCDASARLVALSLALVAAVAMLLAGASLAAAASDTPSKEMVDAMVADLGLTPAQARERIRAEDKAARIQPAARQAAGAAFAGSFFDAGSNALVVAVTDAAVFAAVRAAGAEPRLAGTSYADLEETLHVLDSRTGTAPPQVTGWRIDDQANVIAVSVVGGPTQAVKTFVSGLKHVRVDYGSAPVTPTANLVGGMAILSSGARCSLGFNARTASFAYVITAGHCTNTRLTWMGDNGSTIGSVAGSSFPGDDYGIIRVTNTAGWTATSQIQGGPSVLGSAVAPVGSYVCRSGSTTGYHCGSVQALNQTVNYTSGTVYGLTRTNVCAEPGDSGGSFISSKRQAQGVTSGGSGNCSSGATTFFQPVNEILSHYGLTLVTG